MSDLKNMPDDASRKNPSSKKQDLSESAAKLKHASEDIKREALSFMSKNPRNKWIAAAAVLIIAFILFPHIKGLVVKAMYKPKPLTRPVSIAEAVQKDVPVYIDSFGNMTTLNNTDVKAQVTGQILKIHFNDGDEVKEGDLLFSIDPSLYKAALEKAGAAVAQDEIDLKLKRDTLARNEQLVAKNLISPQDYEKLQTDVAYAQAKFQLDKASEDQARINLEYCSVKAPISGLTSKRQVDVGNIIIANTGSTLVNIKTINELYVDFTIPEKYFQSVQKAFGADKLTVQVSPGNDGAKPRSGQLIFLDNSIDYSTGTVALRAVIDNSDHAFWPGQFVRVRLIISTLTGAVLVPSSAIQMGQKGQFLFSVTDDEKADLKFIEIGPKDGDLVVVYGGVKPGERVITAGQLMLRPGTAVIDSAKIEAMQKQKAGKKDKGEPHGTASTQTK